MSFRRQHIRNTRAVLEAGTPLEAEYPYDQTLKAMRVGDGSTLGGFLQKKWGKAYTVSPPQITANQNNYSPTDLAIAEALLLNADAARDITGLALGATDRVLTLYNTGAPTITLKNASASSTAANRFALAGSADYQLRSGYAITLLYSAATSRWIAVGDAFGWRTISDLPEGLTLSGSSTLAQITANQNDYAISTAAAVARLSSDASRNITGIAAGTTGRIFMLVNVGAFDIVLKNQDINSTIANRFDFGADVTLSAKKSALIEYDATDSRWKMVANTAGASVANGAVTPVTLATNAIPFGAIINGFLDWQVAGNALTVSLKTLGSANPSASDPVYVSMRSTTVGSGQPTLVAITAALSVTISSGSSIGTVTNDPFRAWCVLFDDAGTSRLGIINCWDGSSIYPLAGWGVESSTAEGGAGNADSAHVIYTGTAVAAKAFSVLGWATWEAGLTAGAWSTNPTRVHMQGGSSSVLPGEEIRRFRSASGALATGATTIPADDTIPQSTEGDQYFSLTLSARSAANLIRHSVLMSGAHSQAGSGALITALFQDSAANAIAAAWANTIAAGSAVQITLAHMSRVGTTASTTFKVRAGGTAAGTFSLNGAGSARFLGGALQSSYEATELMA
jgi:hypothetical protein